MIRRNLAPFLASSVAAQACLAMTATAVHEKPVAKSHPDSFSQSSPDGVKVTWNGVDPYDPEPNPKPPHDTLLSAVLAQALVRPAYVPTLNNSRTRQSMPKSWRAGKKGGGWNVTLGRRVQSGLRCKTSSRGRGREYS